MRFASAGSRHPSLHVPVTPSATPTSAAAEKKSVRQSSASFASLQQLAMQPRQNPRPAPRARSFGEQPAMLAVASRQGWVLACPEQIAQTGVLLHRIDLLDPGMNPDVRIRGRHLLAMLSAKMGASRGLLLEHGAPLPVTLVLPAAVTRVEPSAPAPILGQIPGRACQGPSSDRFLVELAPAASARLQLWQKAFCRPAQAAKVVHYRR